VAGGVGFPLRWAVVIVDLDPIVGSEQAGIRRALVVSYEPFHQSPNASVCPISARSPKYPNEVHIPNGHAGQTKDGTILCQQVRTISLHRIKDYEVIPGGGVQYVTDPAVRAGVRDALTVHFGLDIAPGADGAQP